MNCKVKRRRESVPIAQYLSLMFIKYFKLKKVRIITEFLYYAFKLNYLVKFKSCKLSYSLCILLLICGVFVVFRACYQFNFPVNLGDLFQYKYTFYYLNNFINNRYVLKYIVFYST